MARLKRFLPALLCTAVVVALLWLPREDAARQAALGCSELLRLAPAASDAQAAVRKPMAEEVLASSAVVRDPDGVATLAVHGVRFASIDPQTEDATVHDLARRSLIRGLRTIAAEQGIALKIDGEQMATVQGRARGVNFLATLDKGTLSLLYTLPNGPGGQVRKDDFVVGRCSSLLPFLVAIALALLWRRPLLALFVAACCAAFLMRRSDGVGVGFSSLVMLPDVFTRMLWPQLANHTRLMFLGTIAASIAMVAVMTKSGGTRGLVDALGIITRGRRGALTCTWLLGMLTFVDETASRLLVGATMRPVSDRFRISREKLAYLVDSTAAAAAGLLLFTTWATHEVAAFAPALPGAKLSAQHVGEVMVEMLPWRFYCIFTLAFAALLALSGRDFGSMLGAERRARLRGLPVREGSQPMLSDTATQFDSNCKPRAYRALVPLGVFAFVTAFELVRRGLVRIPDANASLVTLLAVSSPHRALLLGSSAGLAVAVILALLAGVRGELFNAAWVTFKATCFAAALLCFSWALSAAAGQLRTANYLVGLLHETVAPVEFPCVLFLLAAALAFATGTARGALTILLPLVVAVAYQFGERIPLGGHGMTVLAIAALLEGALFGRHASPFSANTILGSIATASDHGDHARTQLNYAIVVMLVTLCAGYFPCGFLGWSPWLAIAVGCIALLMIVFVFGRKCEPKYDAPEP